ncbi:hypothetical protein CAAN1_03S04170 [[Candida] anglica]|uniref:Ribonuclease H2 subunit B n=1 Tax=[Candida] anglica TaxID=148631 RepID=A0ABP0EKI9_9ASCO
MQIDSSTRILVLPDNVPSFKIVNIPSPVDLSKTVTVLFSENQLFELIDVSGNNPYHDKNIELPKTSGSVKSWIFETQDPISSEESGYVIQSPNVTSTSKFNLTYLLISILSQSSAFGKRFITLEDFVDTLGSTVTDNTWVQQLYPLYEAILPNICDAMIENDETFYRYSEERSINFIHEKVLKLTDFISNSISAKKDYQLVQSIRNNLYESLGDAETIPENILKQAIQRNCIDLICGSYCSKGITQALFKSKNYDFSELDAYLVSLVQKKKDLEMVEQNMNSVVETTKSASKKKAPPKKATASRKPVKKVAIGKGALDGFFKKA